MLVENAHEGVTCILVDNWSLPRRGASPVARVLVPLLLLLIRLLFVGADGNLNDFNRFLSDNDGADADGVNEDGLFDALCSFIDVAVVVDDC